MRLATTAVVAGTAAHMGAKSGRRSAEEEQAESYEAAPPDAAPPEAASAESGQIAEIKQLAALKDQGILTNEEFSAKKAQILGL
jgi:hypothetical protein